MKVTFFGFLAMIACLNGYAQNIPEGYLLQYQQDFSNSKAINDFSMNRPWSWGISRQGNNGYMNFTGCDTLSIFPLNMAILNNKVFGDFILEADVLPVKDSAEKRGACLFLGIRDSSKYYYVHLASLDSISHGIYLVRDSAVTLLTNGTERAFEWNEKKAHKIRLERNIVKRTIRVFIDEAENPLLLAKDYEFVMGSVGFGTLSGPARFDNIKIWAPTVITDAQLKEMYGK